jgi:ELWxxDGT repeat protein
MADTSPTGAVRLADINPGSNSSSPQNLASTSGYLYFSADDGVSGRELWRTDGLTTSRVADINNATASASPSAPVAVGGTIFFTANDGFTGLELYKTDGTSGGTARVADLAIGPNSSSPQNLTAVGATLYFTNNADSGRLWKSDGTAAGTNRVSSNVFGVNSLAIGPGGDLFFSGFGSDGSGAELWKSDGTESGTIRVLNIHPTSSSSPQNLVLSNDLLFFSADDGLGGRELWASDGNPGSRPVAFSQFVTAQEDSAQAITLQGQDPDNDSLTFEIVSGTTSGMLNGSGSSFTYTPASNFSGSDSFTFRVFDGTSYSNVATVSITVVSVNDLPVVDAGGDQTSTEGASVAFSGRATDVEDTALTYSWDFGDGQTGAGPTVTHIFRDNGNYTVTLRVRDTQGGEGTDTLLVSVANAVPIVTALNVSAATINEGDSVTVTGALTDAGTLDTHSVTVDWGDGTSSLATMTQSAGSATFTATHSYTDDRPSGTAIDVNTITVRATDDDGESSAPLSRTVTISNVAPTVDGLNVTSPVDENGTATLSGTIADPGAGDTFTLVVDWSDGSGAHTYTLAAGTTFFSVAHQYLDDNPTATPFDLHAVNIISLTDDDGGSAGLVRGGNIYLTGHDILSHGNQNGYSVVVLDYLRGRGTPLELARTGYDIGVVNVNSAFLPDPRNAQAFGTLSTLNIVSTTTAAQFATFLSSVDVLVIPEISGSTNISRFSTFAPQIEDFFNAGGDLFVDTSNGQANYYGFLPSVIGADGPGINQSAGFSATAAGVAIGILSNMVNGFPTHNTYQSPSSVFTIFETHAQGTVSIGAQNVVISDGGLGQALGTTVRNVAPDFPAQANAVLTPADAGAFTRTINFNDPGTLDSHKVTIDWGDGSFSPLGQVLSVTPVGSRSFTLSHTYTREGTFPVSVKLSDDDTGALTHTFQVTVDLNNPPSSADSATATGEDVPYAFSAGDFIFSDPDAGDALAAVEITTLPAAGVLFVDLNGNGHDDGGSETRTAGGTVSIADINAGRFKFRSLAHQSGNPYTSFKFRVSDGEEWSAAAATMTIRVNPVADAPTLSVSGASGNEDAAIPLAISALLVDVDGSETLSINFSGVPAGAALSAGTNNGGGSWTLTAADLPSLTVTPPLHSDGEFTLAVTATSTEVGNGHQAQSLATLAVVVNAVADVPTLSVAAASGLENSPIPLAIASFLVDGDGSESLAITVAGIPAGATLNHGINGGGGTWTLTPADLAGLTITTPDDAQFTLTVTATATESNPSSTNPGVSLLAASRSASIDVTVANIAPTITLNDISSIDENGVATLTGSIADASASSGVVHIDFEELAHSGSGVGPSFNQFHSHGFTFTGYSAALGVGGDAQALTSMGSNTPSAYPGSAGLVNRFFDGTTLLTADNGQPFDLLSLDLSESNRDLANANRTITLVGTRSDSSTVSRSITTDGTFGFQTVLFSNFTDLVSVHWRNVSSVHIDNVRLAADAGDTFALSIDWGDPLSPANTETIDLTSPPAHVEWDASTRTFSVTHRYLDDNPTASGSDIYTVNVTATDDDGGSSGVSSSAVEVNNVAPTLSGLSATSILENGTTTLTGTIADVGVLDTFTVVIDWGNGAETVTNVSAGAFSYTRHYLDDNAADSYPISVTVTDDDLGIVAAGTTVGVANVAPALTLNAVTAIVENGIATLTGTIADPGTLDTFTLVIDWGDPLSPNNVETYIFAASATSSQSFTLTHQYLDDNPSATAFNSYMIAVAVADDDAGSVSVATSVLVHNAAPQGLTISATSVDENGIVTVTGTFTDPGTLDTHKVEIDWSGAGPGEGNTTITTAGPNPAGTSLSFLNGVWTFSATHQYLDDNPTGTSADSYLIGVDVSDDDQGTAGKTTLITVTNVAPTLTNLAATAILENGTTTLTGTIADVGSQDTFQVEIDWNNDGLIDETHTGLSAGPFSYTRQFLDDVPTGTPVDQSPIRVIVTDDDSGSIAAGTVVEVTNVAPTLTLNAIAAIVENGVATLTGTIVDPGTLDTFTVSINWGDPLSPNIVETYTFPASAAGSQTFTLTHQYLDDNGSGTSVDTYTISATVTDDDTGSGSASQTVLVANVAPTLAGLSATSILENGVTTLTGTIADVGSLDTFTIVIDWGNGIETFTNVGAGPFSYARQFLDDSPTGTPVDNLPISVTVTDDDTGTVSVTTAVTVTNVAPVVTSLANSSPCCGQADENEGVTLSATFTDVGTLDTHTSTIDWGDGSTTDGIVVESGGAGSVSGSHAYAQGGIYTITLTVMDDDTGSVSQSTLTVIAGAGVHAGVLQIIGTAGDDQVMINKEGAGQLQVHASFFATNHRTYDLAGISEILIIMCGGDDQVSVGGSVDLKTTIDGGEGNDHLNGGSGTNLILGGAGNDHINGGTARDILIGGLGADRIIGNSQDDILIAGTTDDDNDLDALYALLAEWSRTDRTYAERVAALSASLNDQTVHDDDASDTLTGSAANDWFFVNLESGVLDSVTDGKSGESLTDSD